MSIQTGLATGSSPRLRGTLPLYLWRFVARRFIPAPAGNALRRIDSSRLTPVHPRACGERCNEKREVLEKLGSSPRLRGTRRSFRRLNLA